MCSPSPGGGEGATEAQGTPEAFSPREHQSLMFRVECTSRPCGCNGLTGCMWGGGGLLRMWHEGPSPSGGLGKRPAGPFAVPEGMTKSGAATCLRSHGHSGGELRPIWCQPRPAPSASLESKSSNLHLEQGSPTPGSQASASLDAC